MSRQVLIWQRPISWHIRAEITVIREKEALTKREISKLM